MAPKRIILMYISEVSGHHRATQAVEKALKIISPDVEVLNINGFNYTNPISEKIINRLYLGVIKTAPRVWDYLYDNPLIAERISRIKDRVHKFNALKLKKLFDSFRPDAVACSQAFPCGMCAYYKKDYGASFKLIGMLTDYIPHSYWIYDSVDYYITPSEDISLHLIDRGIMPRKVKAYGIPFDPLFNEQVKKDELKRSLGLHHGSPVILIMGGGHGIGPIKEIVSSLEKSRHDLQEVVVTGINRRLFRWLSRMRPRCRKKIIPLEYVETIHQLMKISDIIITKPGGVTTAEVLAQNMPMIIIKPLPGQEAYNASYLEDKGAALRADEPGRIHELIDSLLDDPEKLRRLGIAAKHLSKPEASFDIARLLLGLPND